MNNVANYDMFARGLKEQKDAYEQRFTDKQDAMNESTALLYEGLTAPFIEQSGMNLLKKGIKRGAKSLGLSDDVINSVQSIGDDIKAGNWSEAGRKIANARNNPVFSPEQQKFLNEKQTLLDTLRGKPKTSTTTAQDINKRFGELSPENKVIAQNKSRLLDVDDYDGQSKILDDIGKSGGSAFEELSASLPRFAPTLPSVPSVPSLDTSDLLSLPRGLSMTDASTGDAIRRVRQIIKPTETAVIKDEDGNILQNSNELERQNLEERIASGTDTEGETKALQSRLRTMIGQTEAPAELSPRARAQQSVESFLKKYKKVKPEDVDITPTSASKPLINPRDVAQDIDIPEGGGYARGLNGYKVDARNIKTATSETQVEPTDAPGVAPEEVDRILGQQDLPGAKPTITEFTRISSVRTQLKENYNKLSDNGKKIYDDKTSKAELSGNDYEGRQQLIQEADTEDKAQVTQGEPKPETSSAEVSQVPDASNPLVSEPDAPPVEEKPSVLEDFGKSLEQGATVDAELGGPEDIVGDVVAGAIGVGTLLFGLGSSHKNNDPPPIKQINPTLQYGVGQI